MKYVNDFGIAPTRGTDVAAGMDFYIPNPALWGEPQIEKFNQYLEDKKLESVAVRMAELMEDNMNSLKVLTAVLLYVSHDIPTALTPDDWFAKRYDDGKVTVFPGESLCVPSGIRTMFRHNWVGIFFNKSGIGRKGFVVKAQVIDEDYTGYVHMNVVNTCTVPLIAEVGQKLSQLIELQTYYDQPEEIDSDTYFKMMESSQRGDGAFGYTGLFK